MTKTLVPAVKDTARREHALGSTRACLRAVSWRGSACWGTRRSREMTRAHAEGHDLLLDWDIRWGLGVQIEPTGEWGMGGIGGCDAFADPGRGYAYAYVTRRLADHERSNGLIDVVNTCLGP